MSVKVMTWVWQHSQSRANARLVLLAIADCASDDGANAYPSMAELVRKTGLSERTIQTMLTELAGLGELDVARNAGPRGCNRYRVRMTPANLAPPQISHPRKSRTPRTVKPQVKPDNPAESAPPQNPHPPQISRPTPADFAPGTVLEPSEVKNKKNSSSSSERASASASRLPDDFAVTDEMVTWAREHTPAIDGRRETEKFIDHWRSASGANARKRDWTAAWRNWMRRADEQRPNGRASPGRPTGSTTDQRVGQGLALAAKFDAMEAKEISA